MGAVLAGGPGAALSFYSSAANWGIRTTRRTEVHVTVPGKRRAQPGIVFHRSSLPADEVTTHDGIPTTTVPRTLFDLAAVLDELQLERAVNEAEIRRLWSALSLQDLLDRYPRRAGSRAVRAVLERREEGALFLRSDLEEMLVRFADEAGFERPETNALVEGFEVDAVWREQRLIIEVDGWEVHKTRLAFERDRERSRILQAAGWRCVPVTHRQLRHDSRGLARDVRRMLATATLAA
jgi:very-short-patch-repair endonuclease